MAKAIWNNQVLAESNDTFKIEGNVYFPPQAIKDAFFEASGTHTVCSWKGEASYYSIKVNGQHNKDAAWFYPDPKPAAQQIKNYVAFWKGVKVEE
ncbi:MAG: DUF427 domain-containing protein [Bacteroidales bacterium]|nr:DUF427 domain-containing protein [Bacteroidales bacterium]